MKFQSMTSIFVAKMLASLGYANIIPAPVAPHSVRLIENPVEFNLTEPINNKCANAIDNSIESSLNFCKNVQVPDGETLEYCTRHLMSLNYQLEKYVDITQQDCTETLAIVDTHVDLYFYKERAVLLESLFCQKGKYFDMSEKKCEVNVCYCENGKVPKKADLCVENKMEVCGDCDEGFEIDEITNLCVVKVEEEE